MNRGFAYGDGFFETIRVINNSIPLLDYHLVRAKKTATFFELEWPEIWNRVFFENLILNQSENNDIVRIDFYRAHGGLYTPLSSEIKLEYTKRAGDDSELGRLTFDSDWENSLIQITPEPAYILQNWYKARSPLSNIKSTSAFFYVKAGLMARQQSQTKKVILLNDAGRVCEGLSQNIFYRTNGQWFGIPLEEGPVEGVYAMYFRERVTVQDQHTTIKQLAAAEHILLTNAVYGIQPITLVR